MKKVLAIIAVVVIISIVLVSPAFFGFYKKAAHPAYSQKQNIPPTPTAPQVTIGVAAEKQPSSEAPPTKVDVANLLSKYVEGGYLQTTFPVRGWTVKLLPGEIQPGALDEKGNWHFYEVYQAIARKKGLPEYRYQIKADMKFLVIGTTYTVESPQSDVVCEDGSHPKSGRCSDGASPIRPIS